MSGLEILGAASAASALLETAIGVIGRFRKAYEKQKDLAAVLSNHNNELASTKAVIRIVEDEPVLRTAAVICELVNIEATAKKLVDCLKAMDPEQKGAMRQFVHQLAYGSKDEKALADVMNELSRVKSSLGLRLQVANVGLTSIVENTITANAEVISRINKLLQQVFGEGQGLKIAELLKDRPRRGDGTVYLSDTDIENSRIVIDNMTEDQALQINGPIGVEGWREVSHLEIRDNKAAGNSIQLNHGTSMEVFGRVLAAQQNSQGLSHTRVLAQLGVGLVLVLVVGLVLVS